MKTKIEIMYQAECIESRKYEEGKAPSFIPNIGDKIHLYFQNPNTQKEYGTTWIVKDRLFLLFEFDSKLQTVQLYCDPYKLENYHDI